MIGAIRKRDILAHPLIKIDCSGWSVFLRALTAGRDQTFLALLTETRAYLSAAGSRGQNL
jgi:hypothetical protein